MPKACFKGAGRKGWVGGEEGTARNKTSTIMNDFYNAALTKVKADKRRSVNRLTEVGQWRRFLSEPHWRLVSSAPEVTLGKRSVVLHIFFQRYAICLPTG